MTQELRAFSHNTKMLFTLPRQRQLYACTCFGQYNTNKENIIVFCQTTNQRRLVRTVADLSCVNEP
jgi:hypothetical protein